MSTRNIFYVRFLVTFIQLSFFPYFAVWLVQEKLLSVSSAALIVGIAVMASRFGSLLFAQKLQHYHKKNVLLLSLATIGLVYIAIFSLAYFHIQTLSIWLCLSIGIGLSISLSTLALSVAVALHFEAKAHLANYGKLFLALNLASGIAPFLGSLAVSQVLFYLPLLPIGFCFLSIIVATRIPPDPKQTLPQHDAITFTTFGGKQFWYLMLFNFLTFMVYAQFYDVFPLYSIHYFSAPTIGILYLISSVAIVLSVKPLTSLIENFSATLSLILAALCMIFSSLLFIATQYHSLSLCIFAIILLSFAEVIFGPLFQTLSVKYFNPPNAAMALAIMNCAWGLGESSATGVGIYLTGNHLGYISFLIGSSAAVLMFMLLMVKRLKG